METTGFAVLFPAKNALFSQKNGDFSSQRDPLNSSKKNDLSQEKRLLSTYNEMAPVFKRGPFHYTSIKSPPMGLYSNL